MPRLFSTYDEAWSHFEGAAEMESFADQYAEAEAQLLTWYIRVPAHTVPGILDLQQRLTDLGGLVAIPADRLHVSVAPATVTEHAEPGLEAELLAQAEKAWADQPPFGIDLGGVNVFPTAVVVEVHGAGPAALLDRLLDAGYWRGVPWRPPNREIFLPHLTVAIAAEARPAAPVRHIVEPHRHADYGVVRVHELQLCRIPVARSRLLQPWDVVGRVPLAAH